MFHFNASIKPKWVEVLEVAESISAEAERALVDLENFQLQTKPSDYEEFQRERSRRVVWWDTLDEWRNNNWLYFLMEYAKMEDIKEKAFDRLVILAKQNKNNQLIKEVFSECLKWGCPDSVLKAIKDILLEDEELFEDIKVYLIGELLYEDYDPQDTCEAEVDYCDNHNKKVDEAMTGLSQEEVVKILVNHEEWLDKL